MAKKAIEAKGKPGRKPRAKAEPAAPPETEAQQFAQISPKKLVRLIKDKHSTVTAIAEQFTGPFGQRIKEAVEKDNLDRTVFAFICRLFKLDDVTLSHKMAMLYYYLDASGLEDRAQKQGTLNLEDAVDKAKPPGKAQPAGKTAAAEEEEDDETTGTSLAPASSQGADAVRKLN